MFNRYVVKANGELVYSARGDVMLYVSHKQAIAAYEAEFTRLKAITDEQCAKVEALRAELATQAQAMSQMQTAINEAYGVLRMVENV